MQQMTKEVARSVLDSIDAIEGRGHGGMLNYSYCDGHAATSVIQRANAASLADAKRRAEAVLKGQKVRQCKRSNCREMAVPLGKQLCPKHKAERDARRAAHFAKPKCVGCGEHTSRVDPNAEDTPLCGHCQTAREEQEQRLRAEHLQKQLHIAKVQARLDELAACTTVEDLRRFILNHFDLTKP